MPILFTLNPLVRLNAVRAQVSVTKMKLSRGVPRVFRHTSKAGGEVRSSLVPEFAFVFLILIFFSVTVSCGQDGAGSDGSSANGETSSSLQTPRTVEEYAQSCSGTMMDEYETVYELVDDLKDGLKIALETNPPRELSEYHNATIKYGEELIATSRLLDGTRRPSRWMFAGADPRRTEALFRADEELNAVLYDLDPETRNTLRRYGCIE